MTLNPAREIPEAAIHRDLTYDHPLFTFESVATQAGLRELNGRRNTFFCGSYFGYGFHEDAVRSSVDVVKALGGLCELIHHQRGRGACSRETGKAQVQLPCLFLLH